MTRGSKKASPLLAEVTTSVVQGERVHRQRDVVAVEAPLEIRVGREGDDNRLARSLAVTMRTPGDDFELAAGFLFNEGLIRRSDDIIRIGYCRHASPAERENVLTVVVRRDLPVDFGRHRRHVFTSSSCGMCGKASLRLVEATGLAPLGRGPTVTRCTLFSLPERLGAAQIGFAASGGLHAAGLFDRSGKLLLIREDVGRHNAVDKVVGRLLLEDRLPAGRCLMMVSGRASYELVQKTLMAGIPLLAAVGAPSSLAVELARKWNLTLVGFLRDRRFVAYSGSSRISRNPAKATDSSHIP